jgi:membrane-bound lytic murein transglycosylase D
MSWFAASLTLVLISAETSVPAAVSSTLSALLEDEVWSLPPDVEIEILEGPEFEPPGPMGPEDPHLRSLRAEVLFRALERFHPLDPDPSWLPEAESFDPEDELSRSPWSTTVRWQGTFTKTGTATFDIPIADDPRVRMWLSYLGGRGKELFGKWMGRLTRWAPVYVPILERHGLPKDLIFLAMVESGLSPKAYSFANAAGPWQFIPATGRRYGLRIGVFVDERRDFERSADAAARYLKALHGEFGDWWLAWAAYNAGEGRVRRAIQRMGTKDFWRLSRSRHFMRETQQYVPKIIAAAIVSKNPIEFGFGHVAYESPLEWEVVTVTVATDLATLARACGSPLGEEDLKLLNPALYRGITPPGELYPVRVPHGRGHECQEGLRSLPSETRQSYRFHRIERGDTIPKIAERYHTKAELILAFNRIAQDKLQLYEGIVVPIPFRSDPLVPIEASAELFGGHPPATPGDAQVVVHRVRNGDSLWRIARKYRVSMRSLRSLNGLRSNFLRVGQIIRVRPRN